MSTTVFTVFHWDFRPSTITVKPRALHFSLAQTKRESVLPTAHPHPIIYIHSFLFEHHLGGQLTKLLLPRLLYVFFISTNSNKNKAWDYFFICFICYSHIPSIAYISAPLSSPSIYRFVSYKQPTGAWTAHPACFGRNEAWAEEARYGKWDWITCRAAKNYSCQIVLGTLKKDELKNSNT